MKYGATDYLLCRSNHRWRAPESLLTAPVAAS
jgi:hypothetical protein